MHLEFLVEDQSGKVLLEKLVPRIIGPYGEPHTYRFIAYRGLGRLPKNLDPKTDPRKRVLLDRLPQILKGYASQTAIDGVVVVVDSDARDCVKFLSELKDVATKAQLPSTLFRLAIEEMEAWYLGDPEALDKAFTRPKHRARSGYVQDSICGTWEILADVVNPGWRKQGSWIPPKAQWAERIGSHLSIDSNKSVSFQKFVQGLRRLTGMELPEES